MAALLDRVNSPADIKNFTIDELRQLCSEIRRYMVDCCSRNPGHLGSSLGAVEIIIGYHYVFDTPSDKIVFDVGHQAYAHKILTGRREAFRSLRAAEGISGFPEMAESPYDAFGTGHSSTSISAALGIAEAARMNGEKKKIVALIGDGALTGGLAFEGLNNAGASKSDLLVILNDNNQSIDKNLGGLHNHLLKVTTSAGYNALKSKVWEILGERRFRGFLQRWVRSTKSWAVKKTGGDIFESLGMRYFGPINGNDIEQVVAVLRKLKSMQGPRVLHCITVKGKGYAPAEKDPITWHAPGRFNPDTGERIVGMHSADRYQDVFGQTLIDLADKDGRVVGVTPAMASGCGMNIFAERHPDRFFDVGIEEEHAVTFSAGLCAGGMRPFCNIYSAFSQRAYDQIIHDVALQKLPVIICLDRAGLVGEDGATHNGAFDLAAYRSIPGCIIAAPKDESELRNLMYSALNSEHGPYIIRYPRGIGEGASWRDKEFERIPTGQGEKLASGSDLAIVGLGHCVNRALEAAARFPGRVSVYNCRFLKPFDNAILEEITAKHRTVITIEDGCVKGGLFGEISESLAGSGVKVYGIGIPDRFIAHDRQSNQRELCGMDTESLAKKIQKVLDNNK